MLRDSQFVSSQAARPRAAVRWLAVGVLLAATLVIAGLRGGPPGSPFDEALLAQAPAGGGANGSANGSIDLTHISNDARMIIAVRPAAVFAHEQLRQGLVELAASGPPALKLLTLDQLEQITVVGPADVEPNRWNSSLIVILHFRQPVEPEAIAKATGNEMVETGVRPHLAQGDQGRRFFYARPNPQTYILGATSGELARYAISRRKGQPALAAGEAWKKVEKGSIVFAIDMEVIRDQISREAAPGTPGGALSAQLDALAPLWRDTEYVAAGVIIDGQTVHFRQVATCRTADQAEIVADTAQAAAALGRNTLRAAREREREMPALVLLTIETAEGLLKSMKVERSDTLVVAQTSTTLPELKSAAASGLATAVGQARLSAQRMTSSNNLKQIGLGLHNFADTFSRANQSRFPPPAIYGKDGKGGVPHSWRVALLPYIGYPQLYNAYNFDEPWDSETNKKVLAQMPPIYRHPLDDPRSTNAAYFVLRPEKLQSATEVSVGAGDFGAGGTGAGSDESAAGAAAAPGAGIDAPAIVAVGPGVGQAAPQGGFVTAFADKEGMSFSQIFDGTSNTIAVVEAKRDIPWTKPEDILFDPAKDLPKLGGYFSEGFNVGLCDGSVKFIDQKIDPKVLKLLIMPQDGTPVPKF